MFIKVAAKCAYYMYFDKQRGASVPMPVTFARADGVSERLSEHMGQIENAGSESAVGMRAHAEFS